MRVLAIPGALILLAGCGVADTATTAAVGGKSKAQEVEQAKEIEQKMVNDLHQAQQQADQRLREAEAK
jgi:hypothetical protein